MVESIGDRSWGWKGLLPYFKRVGSINTMEFVLYTDLEIPATIAKTLEKMSLWLPDLFTLRRYCNSVVYVVSNKLPYTVSIFVEHELA